MNDAVTDRLDARDEIMRLEARIDRLATRIENCRKIIVVSRAVVAVGGLLLAAMILGVLRFDPLAMVVGIVAVLGGIVLAGSNGTTATQAEAELKSAEARRAELIGGIELQVVGE
jgi:uncharacterized protein YacL